MSSSARKIWGLVRSSDPIRFGELALTLGKIRPEHLERALATQKAAVDGGKPDRLGEILIRQGALTTAECAEILLEQERLSDVVRLPRVGHFVLLHELGRGGMGVVWRSWDAELHRPIALKMLRVNEERDRLLLQREARLAAQLAHPAIVPIYEVVEHEGNPCIVMALVEGVTVDIALQARPIRRALEVIRDAARAVHYAHGKGVVHRDLKPQNLMVDRENRVAVMDFGLAKSLSAGFSLSKSGGVVGTPTYMAPEQALGKREEVGPRSDVYGLGATLYSLIAGRHPFEGDTPARVMMLVVNEPPAPLRKVRPELHPDIETIVAKAMEKEPSRRYATADALADDLDRALAGLEIVARPVSVFRRLAQRSRRAWAAALLILFAIAGLGWAFLAWRAESARRRAMPHLEEARQALEQADRFLFRESSNLETMREQIERAKRAVERAIVAAPTLPECFFVRGQIHQLEGDATAAEADFSKALELDPDYAPCRVRRALFRLARRMVALEVLESSVPFPDASWEAQEEVRDLDRAVAAGAGLSDSDREYVRAALEVARKNYEEADRRCADALRGSETEDLLRLHAFVLNRLHRHPEAAKKLRRAIQLKYYDGYARIALVNLLCRDRQWHEAQREIDVAVPVLGRQPEVFLLRGKILGELGDRAKAVEDLSRAIELDPRDGTAPYNRALLWSAMGRLEEALEDGTRSISLYRAAGRKLGEAEARNNRANTLVLLGRRDEALAEWEEAERLNPRLPHLYFGRGCLYLEMGDADRALIELRKAIQLDGNDARGWFLSAKSRVAVGEYGQARIEIDRAIDLAPENIEARALRGQVRRLLGDYSGAELDVEEALRRSPDSAFALVERAWIHDRKKNYARMEDDAGRAAELYRKAGDSKNASTSMCVRATARVRAGRDPEALADIEEALRLDAKNEWAYFDRAIIVEFADPRAAAADYERAVALKPRWATAWVRLGLLHLREGNVALALPAIDKAAELEPENALAALEQAARGQPDLRATLDPLLREIRARNRK